MRLPTLVAGLVLALAVPACAWAQNDTDTDEQVLERSGEDGSTDTAPKEEREARSFAVIGLSRMRADYENVDPALNLDVALGARLIGWLSAEGAISVTVAPGSNSGPQVVATGGVPCDSDPVPIIDPDGTPDGCDPAATGTPPAADPGSTVSSNRLQSTNLGVFAVLRTPGRLYGVGKYGYRAVNCSIPEIQEGGDRKGVGYSWGAGYRFGVGLSSLEITYTKWGERLDTLGLSLAYGFGASPGTGAH